MEIENIQLTGITCEACVKLIQRRLQRLPQIKEVVVERSGQTRIVADRAVAAEEIGQALAGTPYQVA